MDGAIKGESYAFTYISFSVDTDTHYSIEHAFGSSGDASPYREVQLYDESTYDRLYSFEYGRDPFSEGYNPNFGQMKDSESGNATGILTAGTYTVYSWYILHAFEGSDNESDAFGTLGLTLDESPSSAVPEPATLAVWSGLGLAGLLMRRRAQAKAARSAKPR